MSRDPAATGAGKVVVVVKCSRRWRSFVDLASSKSDALATAQAQAYPQGALPTGHSQPVANVASGLYLRVHFCCVHALRVPMGTLVGSTKLTGPEPPYSQYILRLMPRLQRVRKCGMHAKNTHPVTYKIRDCPFRCVT